MNLVWWLFAFRGRVTPGEYLRWGVGLMASKMLIDWTVSTTVLEVPWSPFWYVGLGLSINYLTQGDPRLWPLLLLSIPFCWIGVALTVRRLRDAGASPSMVALFVVPMLNWLLFAVAAGLPTARVPLRPLRQATPSSRRDVLAVVLAIASSVLLVVLAIGLQTTYGFGLFIGIPFVQGFVIGAASVRRSFPAAFGLLMISGLLSVGWLIVLAFEGIACIVMSMPLWATFGLVGLAVGRTVRAENWRRAVPVVLVALGALRMESLFASTPAVFEVATEVRVAAAPQAVWDQLVTFGEIAEPTELPFRVGIAYPTHATIEGRGEGAVRRCSFNTGDFVEPIEVWDEPRSLRFSVEQCPQPMIEWNPFHDHVDAAHLHGFFAAKRGQFELLPQPDGTTLLRGTTWYSHGLQPESYWRLWSDWLVHSIHRRVLEHIRERAER